MSFLKSLKKRRIRRAPALGIIALLATSLFLPAAIAGAGAEPEAASYFEQDLSELKSRSLLGLFSDNFTTQMYGKTAASEHEWVGNHKLQVRWNEIEPSRDAYNWTKLDGIVNNIIAEGSDSICFLIGANIPGWAQDASYSPYAAKAVPRNMADWNEFCFLLAGRYGSAVDFYEMLNEPGWDVDSEAAADWDVRHFGGQVETDYLPMLQSAYDAIKKADGTAYVICGAMPYTLDAEPTAGTEMYSMLFDDVNRPGQDVSMSIHSDTGIIAERPMYFTYSGAWTGGHDVVGATTPQTQWLFAEGYTGDGFEEWLCLQNPNTAPVTATVTFFFDDGAAPMVRTYALGASSRFTIKVNDVVGAGRNVSIKVTTPTGQAIVAERPMYFNYKGVWTGGHDVLGANAAQSQWNFAEGYTGYGFDEWLCLMNPNSTGVTARITYIFGDGAAPLTREYPMAANSRYTVNVNNEVGPNRELSVKVESVGGDIVAERPMYFEYQGTAAWGWTGGHNVMGIPAPGSSFYFAEGYTGAGFEEWLCLMNPNASAVQAQVTYIYDDAAPMTVSHNIAANSRFTINVNDEAGPGRNVSISVASIGGNIVAERPMYFNFRGSITGGHDVIGAAAPGQDWYFAEGCTGYGIEEWLCLQNPGSATAAVDITFMMKSGHTLTRRTYVPAKSRATYNINTLLGFSGNCDGVAAHPYKNPQDWGTFYAAVVNALVAEGCGLEVICTEIGWPNHSENPPGQTEQRADSRHRRAGNRFPLGQRLPQGLGLQRRGRGPRHLLGLQLLRALRLPGEPSPGLGGVQEMADDDAGLPQRHRQCSLSRQASGCFLPLFVRGTAAGVVCV